MDKSSNYKTNELYTVDEAAAYIERTTRNVRYLIEKKEIDAVMLGAQWFIVKRSLHSYKERRDG